MGNRFGKKHTKFNKFYRHYWFLFWIIIYFVLYYLSSIFIVNIFEINNYYLQIIFIGFIISIISRIIHSNIKNYTFRLNFNLFIWTLVYILLIYGFNFLLNKFLSVNLWLNILIVSLGLTIFIDIIKKNIKFKVLSSFSIIITILFILLIFLSGSENNVLINLNNNSFDFKNLFYNIKYGNCPQIDVPISEGYLGLNIANKSYDGCVIKGKATCRSGTEEGENSNYYYCGGFRYNFGYYDILAYVEKIDISLDGSIGKTRKHIIWNIYDENKNFIKTKCLGDPDVFNEKQDEAIIKSLQEWM